MDAAGPVAMGSSVLALVASLALLASGQRVRAAITAVVLVLLSLLTATLLIYVFASDGYTHDGRTVWEVSNSPRRLLLLSAAGLTALAAATTALARRRRRWIRWVPVMTVAAVLTDYVALISTVE